MTKITRSCFSKFELLMGVVEAIICQSPCLAFNDFVFPFVFIFETPKARKPKLSRLAIGYLYCDKSMFQTCRSPAYQTK